MSLEWLFLKLKEKEKEQGDAGSDPASSAGGEPSDKPGGALGGHRHTHSHFGYVNESVNVKSPDAPSYRCVIKVLCASSPHH